MVPATQEFVPLSSLVTVLVGGVALAQPEYVLPAGAVLHGTCPGSVTVNERVPPATFIQETNTVPPGLVTVAQVPFSVLVTVLVGVATLAQLE